LIYPSLRDSERHKNTFKEKTVKKKALNKGLVDGTKGNGINSEVSERLYAVPFVNFCIDECQQSSLNSLGFFSVCEGCKLRICRMLFAKAKIKASGTNVFPI